MAKLYKKFIKDFANKLRQEASGGFIYGEKVDLTDPDQCLIAGYYLGSKEQLEVFKADEKRIKMLFTRSDE